MTYLKTSIAASRNGLSGQGLEVEGEQGQTLVEYAMILGLIALVVLGVVVFLGTTISSIFNQMASAI
jgi:pilus assembly protein Flp/PilA